MVQILQCNINDGTYVVWCKTMYKYIIRIIQKTYSQYRVLPAKIDWLPAVHKTVSVLRGIFWINLYVQWCWSMTISWHKNTFLITGPLCGETTGHLWIFLLKGQSFVNYWTNSWLANDLRCHETHMTSQWCLSTGINAINDALSYGIRTCWGTLVMWLLYFSHRWLFFFQSNMMNFICC